MTDWVLRCSECEFSASSSKAATVCPECGMPLLVEYDTFPAPVLKDALSARPWSMWRYREQLPLVDNEAPVTLGEGGTPLLRLEGWERELGLGRLWIKDEAQNPTGSFKARGLSAAITRASALGIDDFVVPTAGNAGVALSAYASRAKARAKVFAPRSTPPRILQQIKGFGGDLTVVDGHIGDCGRMSRQYSQETGAFDMSTLREPYRIEGKKTMGLELAEQLGWELPDAILYPTGGGTGLIGMWKAFRELASANWIPSNDVRLYSVQASGCAPVVRAFEAGVDEVDEWEEPETIAAGLRVPAPLGGRLILRALRETGGSAVAVTDQGLEAERLAMMKCGIDIAPEGGAVIAALRRLISDGTIEGGERVLVFNTGSGWLYETDAPL